MGSGGHGSKAPSTVTFKASQLGLAHDCYASKPLPQILGRILGSQNCQNIASCFMALNCSRRPPCRLHSWCICVGALSSLRVNPPSEGVGQVHFWLGVAAGSMIRRLSPQPDNLNACPSYPDPCEDPKQKSGNPLLDANTPVV